MLLFANVYVRVFLCASIICIEKDITPCEILNIFVVITNKLSQYGNGQNV